MQAAADYRQERHELDAILASGILNRAPNPEHLLPYVCAKYFEGTAEQIKEYNIAVEALGRPADFDQKRDSIVRVEAHRLRKRLRSYYEADGADHAIRIDIPPGQYAPRFLPAGALLPSLSGETLVTQDDFSSEVPATAEEQEAESAVPAVVVATPVAPRASYPLPNVAVIVGLLVITAVAGVALWRTPDKKTEKATIIQPSTGAAVANSLEVRILAGR